MKLIIYHVKHINLLTCALCRQCEWNREFKGKRHI